MKNKESVIYFFLAFFLFPYSGFSQEGGFILEETNIEDSLQNFYTNSYALVIGNSEYVNGWQNLQGVKNDIATIVPALENNGFVVQVAENLTKEALDKTFIDFITLYGQHEKHRLLFFFAGHGYTINNYGQVLGYIVPTDAPYPLTDRAGFINKALPMSRIEEYSFQAQSKHILFVFDACFSGSIFAYRGEQQPNFNMEVLQPVRQFITSGSENETVPAESIFCKFFHNALTTNEADFNNDTYLTATELGIYLQQNVTIESNYTQHPQYGKWQNQYFNKGDFIFFLKKNNPIPKFEYENILTGKLQITSTDYGELYVDENFIKIMEANSLVYFPEMNAGIHSIELRRDGVSVWKNNFAVVENIENKLTISSNLEFGGIEIFSEFSGTIFIDNEKYSEIEKNTEMYIHQVPAGERLIEIKGSDYWHATVTVGNDKITKVRVRCSAPVVTANTEMTINVANNTIYLTSIQGNTFLMGNNSEDAHQDETPHRVHVDNFVMMKYEVTVELFGIFVEQTGYVTDSEKKTDGYASWIFNGTKNIKVENINWRYNSSGALIDGENWKMPVVHISWNDATVFASWLKQKTGKNWRLPTEAEWEYAAKAGENYSFAGSDNIDEVAWYKNNSQNQTHIVGQKKPNLFGIYDLTGNVREFCNDWYNSDYYKHSPLNNPTGAETGTYKVCRGGCWNYEENEHKNTFRGYVTPNTRNGCLGFRLVYSF